MALTLVLCFLPWCIAVGACIVLSPKHLDLVAFHTGYHNLNEIPRGIRRFAHWADIAVQHILIFVAFVVSVFWFDHSIGATLAASILARFVYVWRDFRFDKAIPLGADDRQTMYFLMMNYEVSEEFCIAKPDGGRIALAFDQQKSEGL